MLLDGEVEMDKIQGVASELRNCIKSIEWDLEDLEQTISILLIPSLWSLSPRQSDIKVV